jgi:hypothetical protein
MVVSLEDYPQCPDPFCMCPYHPKPCCPPNSPPSGGAGYYDPGGPLQYYSNQFA